MNHLGYWDDDDYYRKEGPRKLNLWQKFVAYVLPWIVLGAICYGLFISLESIIVGLYYLSEPLSEVMRSAGL